MEFHELRSFGSSISIENIVDICGSLLFFFGGMLIRNLDFVLETYIYLYMNYIINKNKLKLKYNFKLSKLSAKN